MRKTCGNVLDNLKGDCYEVRIDFVTFYQLLSLFLNIPVKLQFIRKLVMAGSH